MNTTQKIYIICTTARSGSNLVCDYLFNTGYLGRPTELFNPKIVMNGAYGRRFGKLPPVSISQYISWMDENFSTKNGVLGIKLLWEDMEYLGRFSEFSNLLEKAYILRLSRLQKLGQAISYFLAQETGQWIATDPARKQPHEVDFDFHAIDSHLQRLCAQDAKWDAELDARGVSALHWRFEDFVRDPSRHVHDLAESIGINITGAPIITLLEKQSTDRSKSFASAFRHEAAIRRQKSQCEVTYEGVRFFP